MIRHKLYYYHKDCRCAEKVHYYETTYEQSSEYKIAQILLDIANEMARAIDEDIMREYQTLIARRIGIQPLIL